MYDIKNHLINDLVMMFSGSGSVTKLTQNMKENQPTKVFQINTGKIRNQNGLNNNQQIRFSPFLITHEQYVDSYKDVIQYV